MTIAILGACGRTGRLVCQEAERRSHKVVALSRNKCSHVAGEMIIGDALNIDDLKKAIKKADIVISALGHAKLNEGLFQTEATKKIISIIGDKKLITLTGTGVRQPGDKVSITDKILNIPLKLIDKSRIDDGVEHVRVIQHSNINYIVLRVLKLVNGNSEELYSLTPGGPAKITINRRTVAKILVDLAENSTWDKKMPVVSNK